MPQNRKPVRTQKDQLAASQRRTQRRADYQTDRFDPNMGMFEDPRDIDPGGIGGSISPRTLQEARNHQNQKAWTCPNRRSAVIPVRSKDQNEKPDKQAQK